MSEVSARSTALPCDGGPAVGRLPLSTRDARYPPPPNGHYGPRGTPNGHSPSNGHNPPEGRGPYPPPNNGEAPPRFLTPADVPNGPTGGFRGV